MFGSRLFGNVQFGMSKVVVTIDQPIYNKQWNKQCVVTSTWTTQRVAESERRNKCNGT